MRRLVITCSAAVLLGLLAAPVGADSGTRPLKGSCQTQFTIGFDPVAGLPVAHITGSCRFTHLGKTGYQAEQLLYPDGRIVNHGTYTAANGDQLHSLVIGSGVPSSAATPTLLSLSYGEWFTGGTGRFADVTVTPPAGPPAVTGTGWADLVSAGGFFQSQGTIGY
jgi:hypothetical protein